MAAFNPRFGTGDAKHSVANPIPSLETRNPVAGELKFTLSFGFATPMEEIQDRVIELVLGFTNGNRKLAGEILRIHPRTIRRRLGKKAGLATPMTSVA